MIYEEMKKMYARKKTYKHQYKQFKKDGCFDESFLKERKKEMTNLNKYIDSLKKDRLQSLLQSNKEKRVLNYEKIQGKDKYVISVFDSVLTRAMGLKANEKTEDIIVVQTFFFEVLEDIIKNGFMYNGREYVLFTASAGQIRTKKSVFIAKEVLDKIYLTLSCGLTLDKINKQGMNVNKYMAYLALNNSATDEWLGFDIDKCIVVEDLETNVFTEVDYIHREDFRIERKEMDVPIPHTDGCGMILPSLSDKAFMVRSSWIKGLLCPFDFKRFISEHEGSRIKIKDIYGDEWDIEEDDIQVIFTKSQFKMWKYYKNWKQYKKYFKKYKCQAGKCNMEPDNFPNATLTYQMLQTLNAMTQEELKTISSKTIETIEKIGRDKETTLKLFGISEENENKTHLQECIKIYNELLKEPFVKDTIKQAKFSLIKRAKSGKIEIDGKYSFISSDLYAFCEYLFLGVENPNGLLKNGEVSCKLYSDQVRVDILRSPHLYREHALRNNVINDQTEKWLCSNVVYTSVHDPITKLIMNDTDGDSVIIASEKILVEVAERHMKDIVPLYYEMEVANKETINNDSLYKGTELAYKGGKIGSISNNISKAWNKDEVTSDSLDVIKYLCLSTNFEIDYAKTLFTLQIPEDKKEIIKKETSGKLPRFFMYAKDKTIGQTEKANESVVNKLRYVIPKNKIFFTDMGIKDFDYKMLMKEKDVVVDKKVIKLFLDKNQIKAKKELSKNGSYVYGQIRKIMLSSFPYSERQITDMLVEYLHTEKINSNKEGLWKCFGKQILFNLRGNLGLCERCGASIDKTKNQKYCDNCSKDVSREKARIRVQNHRKS